MLQINKEKTRMILRDEEHNKSIDICPYFFINKIIKKIPSGCEPDDIEIKFHTNDSLKTMRISMEDYSDSKQLFREFNKNYFIVQGNNRGAVYTELTEQLEENIQKNNFTYEHKLLGWYKIENKNIFLYDTAKIDNIYTSKCIRPCGKFIDGSEEAYDNMLNTCVLNNINMSLAYVLGFSGVVISRISQIQDLGVMIVGLTGRSTTGKTTALKLIASIWGNPDDTQGTLILRNDASEIGFNSQYSGLFGVPILFDDLDTNSKINMNDLLYSLSKGTQRVVANKKGECNFDRMGFSGVSIITGENPLLESTTKKLGLYTRILDFSELAWTPDGKVANEIKKIANQNYGFKGKVFGEYVQNISDKELSDQFEICYEAIKNSILTPDKYTDRIAKKYAVILQTAQLINDCFNLSINEDDLVDLLINFEDEQQKSRNKGVLSYNFLLNYFIKYRSYFDIYIGAKRDTFQSVNSETRLGIATFKKNDLHLCIPIATVKNILQTNGYLQLTNYKKEWKDSEFIKYEKNRYDMSSIELGRHFHFIYRNKDIEIIGGKTDNGNEQ